MATVPICNQIFPLLLIIFHIWSQNCNCIFNKIFSIFLTIKIYFSGKCFLQVYYFNLLKNHNLNYRSIKQFGCMYYFLSTIFLKYILGFSLVCLGNWKRCGRLQGEGKNQDKFVFFTKKMRFCGKYWKLTICTFRDFLQFWRIFKDKLSRLIALLKYVIKNNV